MGGRFKARRRDTRPANSVTFCLHDDEEYLNESLENIRLFSETVLLFDLFSPLAVTIGRGSMDQLITERPETIDEEDLQNRHGVPIVAGIVDGLLIACLSLLQLLLGHYRFDFPVVSKLKRVRADVMGQKPIFST